jgi:hypothetical protein
MVVEKDISRMQEEMTALRAKINSKRDEQRRLQGRKKAIFAGMTAEAAFDLDSRSGATVHGSVGGQTELSLVLFPGNA